MKRLALGLAALALAAGPASAQQELPKPRVYHAMCGWTVVYPCGICVQVGTAPANCVYYA